MKNKNVQILEIDTFWPPRDNESTHHNPFNGGKSHQYWKKNGNSISIHFKHAKFLNLEGAVVAVIAWQLDLQLPMQSVPITTDESPNLDQGEVYNIM